MNQTMTNIVSLPNWARGFKVLLCCGVAAIMTACGGGGGSPPPRFEPISFEGQSAIRDNATGYLWAAQLGAQGGAVPTALELLSVADLGTNTLQASFDFLLNKQVRALEAVGSDSTRAWVIDFRVNPQGVHRLGGLSDEAIDTSALFAEWRVLRRGDFPAYAADAADARGVVLQGNLMWGACSVGRTYIPATGLAQAQCSGGAQVLSQADAQQAARDSRLGGFSDWRLPTKQELQMLLKLGSTDRSLMQAPFATIDVPDVSNPLQYWTSSAYTETTPGNVWIVDFSLVNDWGGAELVPTNSMAFVRLVRSR